MSTTEMVVLPREESIARVSAEDFLPLLTLEQAVNRKHQINQFIGQVLKDGDDYGEIPGANKKKVLLKPGAEKLCSIFGLAPTYHKETVIEDWTGENHGGEPLFYYEYRCQLSRGGRFMGEAIGSCNSWESKYRFRWVHELAPGQEYSATRGGKISEPVFAVEKAETGGKYGKPAEYWQRFKDAVAAGTAKGVKKPKKGGDYMTAWEIDATMYRVPNPDVADIINTVQKIAQKRALLSAVLVVTNCSDAFTPDLEDFAETEPIVHHEQQEPARNVPPEIEALFKDSIPNGATTAAFNLVKAALLEALPQNGEEEYRRILDHIGIRPKGNTIAQSRNAVMQCWTLAQSAKKLQQQQKRTADLGVNMSDLPEGQGRDLPVEEEPAQ